MRFNKASEYNRSVDQRKAQTCMGFVFRINVQDLVFNPMSYDTYALVKVYAYTVKPVLSGHLQIDETKVLKTHCSLMKVESIAECSLGAFCNTFDLH